MSSDLFIDAIAPPRLAPLSAIRSNASTGTTVKETPGERRAEDAREKKFGAVSDVKLRAFRNLAPSQYAAGYIEQLLREKGGDVVDRVAKDLRANPLHLSPHAQLAALIRTVAQRPPRGKPAARDLATHGVTQGEVVTADGLFREPFPLLEKAGLFDVRVMNKHYQDMALNEAIVGMYALNALRQVIPSFQYIYEVYTGKQAEVDFRGTGRGQAFAKRAAEQYYTLSERFGENEPTLAEWIDQNAGDPQFSRRLNEIVSQVFFALIVAREQCEFSHNWLTIHAVRVRPQAKPVTLSFPLLSGGVVKVTTDVVACITDFGASHAKVPFFIAPRHAQHSEGVDSPAMLVAEQSSGRRRRIADMEESEEEDEFDDDEDDEEADAGEYDSDVLDTDDEVFEEPDDSEDEDYDVSPEDEEDEDDEEDPHLVDEAAEETDGPAEEEPDVSEEEYADEDDEEVLTEGDEYSDDEPEEEEEVDVERAVAKISKRVRRENTYHLRPDGLFVQAHPTIPGLCYLNTSTRMHATRTSPVTGNFLSDVLSFLASLSRANLPDTDRMALDRWILPVWSGALPTVDARDRSLTGTASVAPGVDIDDPLAYVLSASNLQVSNATGDTSAVSSNERELGDEDIARVVAESATDRDTVLVRRAWRDLARPSRDEVARAAARAL